MKPSIVTNELSDLRNPIPAVLAPVGQREYLSSGKKTKKEFQTEAITISYLLNLLLIAHAL